jgi:molybdopterin synthase catalytic subunit/molybdopterin converting factor small subunit
MIEVRVRLFAIQRELAGRREVLLDLAEGASIEAAWTRLVELVPALAAGRPAVRFARNGIYADPDELLANGDELACIPPVSGGSGLPAGDGQPGGAALSAGDGQPRGAALRIIELRPDPFGLEILAELGDRLVTEEDGALCGFIGRTRASAGTPAPGQEAEAARHAGRQVQALDYETHESMALAVLEAIAGEIEDRFAVTRLAIVHRTGAVPLGDVSVAVVAVAAHREAAFLAARYAIDELKARAPIWKAEQFSDGHVWVGSPARTGPLAKEER